MSIKNPARLLPTSSGGALGVFEERKVRVVVRVRPVLQAEPEDTCLTLKDEKTLEIVNPKNRSENLVYR